MGMMPFQIVSVWIRGLASILFLLLGPYLLYEWFERAHVLTLLSRTVDVAPSTESSDLATTLPNASQQYARVFSPDWGANRQTALFALGLCMLLWAIPKGPALNARRLLRRAESEPPRSMRTGAVQSVNRPDGTQLRIEVYGPATAPAVVLTHGWSLDSDE